MLFLNLPNTSLICIILWYLEEWDWKFWSVFIDNRTTKTKTTTSCFPCLALLLGVLWIKFITQEENNGSVCLFSKIEWNTFKDCKEITIWRDLMLLLYFYSNDEKSWLSKCWWRIVSITIDHMLCSMKYLKPGAPQFLDFYKSNKQKGNLFIL